MSSHDRHTTAGWVLSGVEWEEAAGTVTVAAGAAAVEEALFLAGEG